MVSVNPFAEFRVACEKILEEALKRLFPKSAVQFAFEVPPSSEFGELSSSVCFELAKRVKGKPLELAESVAGAVDLAGYPIVVSVKAAGNGYVNFYADLGKLAQSTLESVAALDLEYGFVKLEKPLKVIVEHTSANPVHPIHIGTARNPVLGDALARILKALGHVVFRHYYVDDVGRQAAVIAYGYEKLGEPEPDGKPDGFIGRIYAITSCIVEIQKLKKEVEKAGSQGDEAARLMRELHDWIAAATELESANPKLFAKLLDKISRDKNPEARIAELNLQYERGEKESVKQLIRKVSELCLEGFRQSLGRLGISYDSWDWESDFVWNGSVGLVLTRLSETPYVFQVGDVIEFDANKVVDDLGLRPLLGLSEDYEVPSLTLVRADGTTLYTTRDIPYNLWKFRKADEVINVVGMEQKLAQLHLKIALAALRHVDELKRLRHFAYNLVSLPGFKMSGRAGRYITLDETMDEAVKRAYDEVVKRSPQLSEDEKTQISNMVGIGAIKYALLQVDPSKPVVFTWDRVLDFEKNSAPYIQYSYARAGSILRKAKRKPRKADYALLKEPIERDLILILSKFPDVFVDSAENLRPNQIADYCNSLADKFNSFYGALPVIRAEPRALSNARLALVAAVRTVLKNALGLLGIEAPERM
jgi:arginyl-tRNA synthetase